MARRPGILQLLKLKVAGIGEPYYFLGKAQSILAIKEYTGVDVAESNEQEKPQILVEQLIRSGIAESFKLSYEKGGKLHYANILVAADKATSAKVQLVNKSYNGGEIIKVYSKTNNQYS